MTRLYGCNGRAPLKDAVLVQDGWTYPPAHLGGLTREARLVELPDPMSKDCRHTQDAPNDPGCAGCKWASHGA